MRALRGVAVLASLLVGCQSGPPPSSESSSLTLEQAKGLATSFAAADFPQPPRTITDITAILDEQKPDPTYRAAVAARLAFPPPVGADAATMSLFYRNRSDAAVQSGLASQALSDAREGVRYARQAKDGLADALSKLASAENLYDEFALGTYKELYEYAITTRNEKGYAVAAVERLAAASAYSGDFAAARRWTEESDRILASVRPYLSEWLYLHHSSVNARTHALLEQSIGHYDDANRWYRQAISDRRKLLERYPTFADANRGERIGIFNLGLVLFQGELARNLVSQGRPVEAETVSREALLYALQHAGRTSSDTATAVANLAFVLFQQGRTRDAEQLFRAEIETRNALGLPTSVSLNHLADAIAMQTRWPEAIRLYDDGGHDTAAPARYESIPRILALYRVGEIDHGLSIARKLLTAA
jgi:tetratricopeptide (TPR) repeat protein